MTPMEIPAMASAVSRSIVRPDVYSNLMLAARTTLPHLAVSSARSLPNSSGESANTVPPRAAKRALMLIGQRRSDLLVEPLDGRTARGRRAKLTSSMIADPTSAGMYKHTPLLIDPIARFSTVYALATLTLVASSADALTTAFRKGVSMLGRTPQSLTKFKSHCLMLRGLRD